MAIAVRNYHLNRPADVSQVASQMQLSIAILFRIHKKLVRIRVSSRKSTLCFTFQIDLQFVSQRKVRGRLKAGAKGQSEASWIKAKRKLEASPKPIRPKCKLEAS